MNGANSEDNRGSTIFPPCCSFTHSILNNSLTSKVFPKKPLRQWVLSFPFHLRLLFAKNPKVMGEVLNIVNRSISSTLIKKTNLTQKSGAKTGSVTFIQRFGGSLNLNIHFHMMYLEGAYTFVDGIPHFHRISLLRPCEMDCLLKKIVHRVIKHLEKRGLIERGEMGEEYLSMENLCWRQITSI